MFKPQKETRRLFEIFLATLGHKWKTTRVVCGLIATLWQYRLHVVMAAIVTAALALGPFVLLWLGWFALPLPGLDLQLVGVGSWALALLFALAFAVVAAVLFGMVLDLREDLHVTVLAFVVAGPTANRTIRRTSPASYTRVSKSWLAETRARIRR